MGAGCRKFRAFKTTINPHPGTSISMHWLCMLLLSLPNPSSYYFADPLNPKTSDNLERIEKLIDEIKALRDLNHELSTQNNAHMIRIHTLETQNSEVLARAEKLAGDNSLLLEEARLLTKRLKDRLKQLKMEMRKRDVFGEVYRGSLRTKKDEIVNSEMSKLNNLNNILLKFVQALESRFGFDCTVAHDLCTIASGIDDPVLQEFIKGISPTGDGLKDTENIHPSTSSCKGITK